MRKEGRRPDQIRKCKITINYLKHMDCSTLIQIGDTQVLCCATVEEKVPPFLKGTGKGWIRAEYSMLPCSTPARVQRETTKVSGRTNEIQRLIGRALRGAVELSYLGERTVLVDCDVIQADGGTRCASITGGFVSLYILLKRLYAQRVLKEFPIKEFVAAISCGIVKGEMLLDLDYNEDFSASCDLNIVMTESGRIIEIQGTAEGEPFEPSVLSSLVDLAWSGIKELLSIQKKALGISEDINRLNK